MSISVVILRMEKSKRKCRP